MFEESITPEISTRVKEIIDKDPSTMPMRIATQLNISEAVAVRALPESMRTFVDPALFDTVWEAMTGWERITFISQAPGAVIEVKGKLPKGKHGHGYFNLMEKDTPLGGHLSVNALGAICFLEKPFFGLESLSLQFYDREGGCMFAVYAGRQKRELIPSVKTAFHALKEQLKRGEDL